jgi:Ca2+-binding EF-hand superfamily protein
MLINFKLLLGNSLNEEQIKEIVDKTILEYSSDKKYINYNDFVKILNEA